MGYKNEGVEEPAIRQLYSTTMVGPYVQLFVLDYRRGYLGKDQVTWLTEALTNSTARFKIILSGTPFGMSAIDPKPISTERTYEPSGTVVYVQEGGSDNIASAVADAAALVRESIAFGNVPATVSMQIPPPIVALGWDECGRINLSLSAVIASYQQLCVKRKAEIKEQDMERMDDIVTFCDEVLAAQHTDIESSNLNHNINSDINGNTNGDTNININALNQQETESDMNISTASCPEMEIDSGILILSAGSCVPYMAEKRVPVPVVVEAVSKEEYKRKSMSSTRDREDAKKDRDRKSSKGSTYNNLDITAPPSLNATGILTGILTNDDPIIEWAKEDFIVAPFAAVYDPIGTGTPFCFELCVGSGSTVSGGVGGDVCVGGTQTQSKTASPVALPQLGATLLYTASIGDDTKVENKVEKEVEKEVEACDTITVPVSGSYSAVVRLSDDGLSLDLKLLELKSSQDHSLLYQLKLRIPK